MNRRELGVLNKLYILLNIVMGLFCIILTLILFIFSNQKILVGVVIRGTISLIVIFNSIYLLFTNQKSFLISKGKEKQRKLIGIILLVVGLAMLITALMGYGINGYPRLWK